MWVSVRGWMDAHLRGVRRHRERNRAALAERWSSALVSTWAEVSSRTERLAFGPIATDLTGTFGGAPGATWSHRMSLAADTAAYGGIALVSGALAALTGIPPVTWLDAIDRRHAAVWVSEAKAEPFAMRGLTSLHLTIAPSRSEGTLIAYLYDVDPGGVARLVTHAPSSWVSAEPNVRRSLDLTLPATSYALAAGHRLALVVDGRDSLYLDTNEGNSTVSFESPSWLDVAVP